MLEDVLFARGVLTPTNPENVTAETADAVRNALSEQGLWWISANFDAESGLEVQSGFSVDSDNLPDGLSPDSAARHHAYTFATAMKNFVQSETVVSLELSGSLIVTVDIGEDDIYLSRVIFEDSEILFHEAGQNWGIETPLITW